MAVAAPAELLRLPEELARADTLLDDPAFFARKGYGDRCLGSVNKSAGNEYRI